MVEPTSADVQKLLNGPAMAAPPGEQHNFVNPSSLKIEAYVDVMVCLVISTLVVCMRMWTRMRLMHKAGLEDWVCLLAFAAFIAYCAECLVLTRYGLGVHQWNVQLKTFSKFLYHLRVAATTIGFVIFFIKLAILLQYLRIFVPTKERSVMFWGCHGLIWLNLLFYLICAFLEIFACKPVQKFWNPLITTGRCLDVYAINITAAAISTLSDILILVLPQKIIWNLQISLRKRIGISAVFLAGVFACVSSAIRLYYSVRVLASRDVTYYVSVIGLWTILEIASGFLAVCLPVSPRFFCSLKDSMIVSRLGASLHSLLYRSKNDASFISGRQSSDSEAAKPWKDSKNSKTKLNRYTILPEQHELVQAPWKGNMVSSIQSEGFRGSPQFPKADHQITRTIQIATSSNAVREPDANLGKEAETNWY